MKLYHAGLRLGGKEQIAKILKGETVLDEDTTKALGPTLLARLDDASTPQEFKKFLSLSWEYLISPHMIQEQIKLL